jgi:hypothetical protein
MQHLPFPRPAEPKPNRRNYLQNPPSALAHPFRPSCVSPFVNKHSIQKAQRVKTPLRYHPLPFPVTKERTRKEKEKEPRPKPVPEFHAKKKRCNNEPEPSCSDDELNPPPFHVSILRFFFSCFGVFSFFAVVFFGIANCAEIKNRLILVKRNAPAPGKMPFVRL